MVPADEETRRLRLAGALRLFRERSELTAVDVAERMGEGASVAATIRSWESAEAAPSADELWRFLDAVEATFAELEGELDPEAKDPRLREIAAELDAL